MFLESQPKQFFLNLVQTDVPYVILLYNTKVSFVQVTLKKLKVWR